MKATKNFTVRAKKALLKLSPTVKADAADVVVLDDLRDAVTTAAKGDARFNKKQDGSAADSGWAPWCCAVEYDRDEESWAAVLQAADGCYYQIGFEVDKDGAVTLDADEPTKVTRKTTWVEAKCAFNDVVPTVRAAMPKAPADADCAKESDDQKAAARKANLKSAVADAHEDAYPDGEGHGSKANAHQNAQWAHSHAAELASAGPVKDFHSAAADHHKQMAEDHQKVIAKQQGTATADDLSQAAVDASAEARENDTDQIHAAAAKAHRSASDAHSAAMVVAAKARKTDVAAKHAQLMSLHDACADAHGGDDDEAVKSSCAALENILNPEADVVTTNDWSKHDADAIHCRATGGVRIEPKEVWEPTGEAKFVYMPLGVTSICAGFRDKAINLTVEVDEDTAKVVQQSFEDLRASFPKLEPFFCFEHREEEASFHPKKFEFGEVRGEQGVVVVGNPTKAGADNVNGRTHRTFSPSFTTDAAYDKAVERNGVLSFPEGVRGSKSNPAKVTGVAFCGGTLTNKPAFKNMPPVKAGAPKPGTTPPAPEPKKLPTVDEVFARLGAQQSEKPEAVKAKRLDEIFARLGGKKAAPPAK